MFVRILEDGVSGEGVYCWKENYLLELRRYVGFQPLLQRDW
jgi:hypothetical protein